jgi:hypothetical protein
LDPGSGIRDPGSGKNSSRIRIPDPGGKKAPDPGSATLVPVLIFGKKFQPFGRATQGNNLAIVSNRALPYWSEKG